MTPENKQQMDAHVRAIAELLHADATEKGMPVATLRDIEQTVRSRLEEHISPGIGNFLSKQVAQTIARPDDASPAF